MITGKNTTNKADIVTVTHQIDKSLKRLLKSITEPDYGSYFDTDLIISIDIISIDRSDSS